MPKSAHVAARDHDTGRPTESVEVLTRRAFTVSESIGVTVSPSRVSRLVRRYLRERNAGKHVDFDAYFMPHSDPTGEAAIHNAMSSSKAKPPAPAPTGNQLGDSLDTNNAEGNRND